MVGLEILTIILSIYIEFAMRNNTNGGPWIPLQLSYHDTSTPPTRVLATRVVRGYNVPESTTSWCNIWCISVGISYAPIRFSFAGWGQPL